MTEINREHFEAWLFSQPEERKFNYLDVTGGCAVCSFIRETTNFTNCAGGSDASGIDLENRFGGPKVHLPEWMKCCSNTTFGVLSVRPLTIGNMRRRYLELFPEAAAEVDSGGAKASEAKSAVLTPKTNQD